MEKLAEFHLDIQHIAGLDNVVVDSLSQPPVSTKLQLVSAPIMHSSLLDWLALVAPHAGLDLCISAGVSALLASCTP